MQTPMFIHRSSHPRPLALAAAPLATFLATSLTAPPDARATCGSATCFLATGTREGLGVAGQFRLDLSYRYMDQSRMRSGSHTVSEVLAPGVNFESGRLDPDHHREIRTQTTQVQLDLGYGVSERLSVLALLPLVNDRYHEHFDDVGTPDEHFTRSDGSSGFGDLQIGARYALLLRPRDLLVGGASLKLPTGTYRQRDSEGAINEPTIQPGTGSTDLISSVHYSHQLLAMKLDLFASAAWRANGTNPLRYHLGGEGLATAGIGCRTGKWLTWMLQLNGRHAERDRFLGRAVPSTGADALNLTPGLRVHSAGGTAFYGFAQVPLFQRVNESQLTPKFGVVVGVSQSF